MNTCYAYDCVNLPVSSPEMRMCVEACDAWCEDHFPSDPFGLIANQEEDDQMTPVPAEVLAVDETR